MVLADQRRTVALLARNLVEIGLIEGVLGLELQIHAHVVRLRPTAGNHGGAAGHAQRRSTVIAFKADTLFLHAIERGTGVEWIACGFAQPIAPLVGDDHDHVGLLNRRSRKRCIRQSGFRRQHG